MSVMDALNASGFLAQACAEIREAEEAHQSVKARRRQFRQRIQFIDSLINSLEELNLKGISRVAPAYEPHLQELRAMMADTGVTADQMDSLRSRVPVSVLMDSLYDVQEVLFAQIRPNIRRKPAVQDAISVVGLNGTVVDSPLSSAA